MAVEMTFRLTGSSDPRPAVSTAKGWIDRAHQTSEVVLTGQALGERVRREGRDVFSVGSGARDHDPLGGSSVGSPLGGGPDLPDPLGLLVLVQPKPGKAAKAVSCVRSFYAGCVSLHVQREGSELIVTYTERVFGTADFFRRPS
jgi:hypothetical protein